MPLIAEPPLAFGLYSLHKVRDRDGAPTGVDLEWAVLMWFVWRVIGRGRADNGDERPVDARASLVCVCWYHGLGGINQRARNGLFVAVR